MFSQNLNIQIFLTQIISYIKIGPTNSKITLKINGFTEQEKGSYLYYIITQNNTKPEIKVDKYGGLDLEGMGDNIKKLGYVKSEEISISDMTKYTELDQDMYIWIIESVQLGDSNYTDSEGNLIQYSNKFVVEAQKIERIEMPLLDDIIQYIKIDNEEFDILMIYPLHTDERKFTVKIGEVTDREILQKIKNDDYSGIKELLSYSKNSSPIFTRKFEENREHSFGIEINKNLIGDNVLKHNAYYYVYVELDTENGKYYPVEAINLYQAYNKNGEFGINECNWELFDDLLEDDETPKPDTNKPNDETKPDTNKPDTDKPTDTNKPDTDKPTDTNKPDTDKPTSTTKPDTNKPIDTTKPDTNKPIDTTTSNKDIPHTGLAKNIIYVAIILSIVGVIIGTIKYKKYQF